MRFTLALLTLAAAVSAQKYNGPNPWFCSSPGNDCCNGPKGNECSVRGECPCLASTNQNGGPEPECVDWASPVNREGSNCVPRCGPHGEAVCPGQK